MHWREGRRLEKTAGLFFFEIFSSAQRGSRLKNPETMLL
jgi:hypothetical protein